MEKISKNQFISGSFWYVFGSVMAKVVSLVISIILVRILTPNDFGLIAITTVFLNLSDVLIDGGFSTALISKQDVDDLDYSNAFIVNISTAAVLYGLLFFLAPVIAKFYDNSSLELLLRITGITFFLQAFGATRTAKVTRDMRYKFLFVCNLISTVISGVAGIVGAYCGLGVWSLVLQRLMQNFLTTALLFIKVRWKFKFVINKERILILLKLCSGILCASIINYVGNSLYGLVIGKVYSVQDLGYYDKGAQIPMILSLYIFGSIASVLLPTLVSCKNNVDDMRAIVRRVMKTVSYLILPLMIGLLVVSYEAILVLFTEKWLPAVRIMQYFCLYYIFMPITLIQFQVYLAAGHPYTRIIVEAVRLGLIVLGMCIFSFWVKCSIDIVALIMMGIYVVVTGASAIFVHKYLKYKYREMLIDILLPVLATGVMFGAIVLFDYLWGFLSIYKIIPLTLGLKIVLGVAIYVALSVVLKIPGFMEMIGIIKEKLGRNKRNITPENTEVIPAETSLTNMAGEAADMRDNVGISDTEK